MKQASDSSRALRRHHSCRLKKARRLYWGMGTGVENVPDDRRLGIVISTAALCSCHMCGNPRRYWKTKDALTVQEQRLFQDLLQDIEGKSQPS
ncbi:hypothetical protein [Azohydromonas lata]|uniref:Uncharacterized protein n=1 Tax=Azohydromonas lata TaxID=45677 RepID=A0ABU5I9P1_9BURK|nr:hypothetical protein [Azohydromonas lata]MDZ5455331.1 hypothetical protein [Azohydromonas lata]